jgi:hypothetical protein
MFSRAPDGDYIVYHIEVDADGPDDENRIFTNSITLELYEKKPNPKLEADLESRLNARGLKFSKQSRYWVTGADRFQVIYEFTIIIKT